MSDDLLKKFLKENTSEVPSAPLGESSRIWRKINDKSERKRMWWIVLPVMATSCLLAIVMRLEKPAPVMGEEEAYLYQEWSEMVSDVDTDVDQEFVSVFEI
nr:hypothetical protein [uncultured Bdellovibrio sp.]